MFIAIFGYYSGILFIENVELITVLTWSHFQDLVRTKWSLFTGTSSLHDITIVQSRNCNDMNLFPLCYVQMLHYLA